MTLSCPVISEDLKTLENVLTSIAIIAISLALFLYWFRYTCQLILSTSTAKDCRTEVAANNRLKFLEVQSQLGSAPPPSLDWCKRSLDCDFALVNYMHRNTTQKAGSAGGVEELMLRLDYRFLGSWYLLVSRFSAAKARSTLDEMSQIIGYFVDNFAQRAAGAAA